MSHNAFRTVGVVVGLFELGPQFFAPLGEYSEHGGMFDSHVLAVYLLLGVKGHVLRYLSANKERSVLLNFVLMILSLFGLLVAQKILLDLGTALVFEQRQQLQLRVPFPRLLSLRLG